jgi:16S rRNA (guanine966-N2)-methyltransferase
MRVISGKLKGRVINFIRNSRTRPLKDSVKENIFNILNHSNLFNVKMKNSKVLDLYSGIGSFGIECISRGANNVTFVEKDITATKILNQNLISLSISNKSKIFTNSIEFILKENINERYDIFFLDPPFSNNNFFHNLKTIKEKKIYNKNHVVVIHREDNSLDNLDNILNILDIKKYGRSKIIFGIFF